MVVKVVISAVLSNVVITVFTPARSPTSKDLNKIMSVQYVAGSFSAEIYQDVVGFADIEPGFLNCTAQFGLITKASNFFPNTTYETQEYGFDGILGLAYRVLASDDIEPLFPNFVSEGKIGNEFSIELCTSDLSNVNPNGSALFLGTIPDNATHAMKFTPMTAEVYYSVQVLGMKLGTKVLGL